MADVEHVITTGQSLAIGSQGAPPLSTVSEAPNARFASGASLPAWQQTTGEQRPDLSMGYRIAQSVPSAELVALSTHGLGGQTIAQLSKGGSTGKYEEAISRVAVMKASRDNEGKTYRVRSIHWIQGEQDQYNNLSMAEYVAAVRKLYAEYDADVRAITGQVGEIPFIMSQTATWGYYASSARIGLAQLEAARTIPGVYIVGGQYQLPYIDNLHLTNVGYYKLGELHARADIAVRNSANWKPFAPSYIDLRPEGVALTFDVPSGSAVLDTTSIPLQPNFGFSLSGTAATISGVTLDGTNQIFLSTSKPVTEEGARVGYGVSSGPYYGLGNFRDSEATTSVHDGGKLYNWALHFNDLIPGTRPQIKPEHAYRVKRSMIRTPLGYKGITFNARAT